MRNNRYIYIETKTKEQFLSYTDIAEKYNVGKGVVAGRFYRTKDNTITINGVRIKRIRYITDLCIKERRKSIMIMPEPTWNMHALDEE